MKEIKYIIETIDGRVLGFDDMDEMIETQRKLVDEGNLKAAFGPIRSLMAMVRDAERNAEMLQKELMDAWRFHAKLRKNGAFSDGRPRYSLSISKKIFRDGGPDPERKWGILIVRPELIDELDAIDPHRS